ncbi:hypothetical protein PLEOSDRAFT_168482 [Pleurotus ostreatus PC15]|uniref:Uncharacterized protein n=1 Tax=Pleurotus ostreatus (strain PC15) TaxID=1137138 RepID=A0A067NK29_PLEO1|nr:hypothetical protein PLEOSDRAFT_168482 [Pleurotus ostreatus PC15]
MNYLKSVFMPRQRIVPVIPADEREDYENRHRLLTEHRESLAIAIAEALAEDEIPAEEKHAMLADFNKVASIHLLLLLEAEETLSEETPLVKAANVCFEEMEVAEKAGHCRVAELEPPEDEEVSAPEGKGISHRGQSKSSEDEPLSGDDGSAGVAYRLEMPGDLMVSLLHKQPLRTNLELGNRYVAKFLEDIKTADVPQDLKDRLDSESTELKDQLMMLERFVIYPLSVFPENIRLARDFAKAAQQFDKYVQQEINASQLQKAMSQVHVSSASQK